MIPSSLLMAIAAGVCSGLLAGILLAETRDNGSWDVTDMQPSGAGILTDRDEYGRGEPVRIRIIDAAAPAGTGQAPVRVCITALDGTPVGMTTGHAAVQPGGAVEHVWDQARGGGQPVFDGVYVVAVCNDNEDRFGRATILIHGKHPTLQSLLGGS